MNFFEFLHRGGWAMAPLLVFSIGAVAVIIDRILIFRALAGVAPDLAERVIAACRAGRFAEAEKAAATEKGALAAALAAILKHRGRETRFVEREVEAAGQSHFLRLEKRLSFLELTTTVAPLLGLLGTLSGMIGTFNAIASQTSRENSDKILAGVGEALYATAAGICIAVVAFCAYNYFATRLRNLTGETELAATQLINALLETGHLKDENAIQNPPQPAQSAHRDHPDD